jgi:hypothetical protein
MIRMDKIKLSVVCGLKGRGLAMTYKLVTNAIKHLSELKLGNLIRILMKKSKERLRKLMNRKCLLLNTKSLN